MTSPNYSDPEQMPDALNAGSGLSGASTTSPADMLQGQMSQVGGPLGAVAGWLLGGLAPKLIADAEESADSTSPTGARTTAAERVMDHISDVGGQVTKPISLLMEAIQGTLGGGFGAFSALSALMGSKWETVDDLVDGQGSLLDRVDLLSPLQDYGAAYCPQLVNTGWSGGEFKIAYTAQIGPRKNVELDGTGGFILEEEGLWDVRARAGVGTAIINGNFQWEIRIYPPDRSSIFSVLTDYHDSTSQVFREMSMPIVVPAPGYRVEVWVTVLTNNRFIQSGARWTRLSVQHISRSTTHQIEEV